MLSDSGWDESARVYKTQMDIPGTMRLTQFAKAGINVRGIGLDGIINPSR